MIARIFSVLVVVAVAAAVLLAAGVVGGSKPTTYRLMLDNAGGLTDGVDFRVGGVRVGKVDSLDIQDRTAKAIVILKVQDKSFGTLRKDAFCKVQPQSLIGEFFVDCQPGKGKKLANGGTIPVDQTATSVRADFVQNILRLPQREQLSLLLSELGATVAARGPDLNRTIRRGIPALRETDKVLKILADERAQLNSLTRNSDVVLGKLANRRRDVTRFVSEARDTAVITNTRRRELRGTIRRLPPFLRQLRPSLRDLSNVADRLTPALGNLRAAAPTLTTLLNRLGPFSDAARPAVRTLGKAADKGTRAVKPARATVAQLRKLTTHSPELAKNLSIVLPHLDDRDFAVEKNALSPGGQGYTGLEAFVRYPYFQSQAINIYDSRGYFLKLNVLISKCAQYRDAESVKKDPGLKDCSSALGPNQPGINQPDPSPNPASQPQSDGSGGSDGGGSGGSGAIPGVPTIPGVTGRSKDGENGSTAAPKDGGESPSIDKALDNLLGGTAGAVAPRAKSNAPGSAKGSSGGGDATGLLDYLLAP